MRKLLPIFLQMLISSSCYALQIKAAVNNETISAKISSTDVTRVLVQGDRIQSVRGVKGAYTRENDNNNGEVYIQPSPFYQNRAFTVLINTEMGRHFTLLLTPMAVPSDTLMLVPKGVGQATAAKFENASAYELTITHLVRAMTAGKIPSGYVIKQVNNKTNYYYGNIATLKLHAIYEGFNLRGEIWEITNNKNYTITLNERDFYRAGIRAISLEEINVAPHSKTNLYRVISNA